MAGSIVLGARLMAAADDAVAVWSVVDARGAGSPLGEDDVVVQRVRFVDAAAADRYLPADEPLPEGAVLAQPVGAGELLARSALATSEDDLLLQVPIEVDPNRVPPAVEAGSVVDIWVSDGAASATAPSRVDGDDRSGDDATSDGPDVAGGSAGPALGEVTVVDAPAYDDTFAVTGARQLVVAVPVERAAAFEHLLGSLQDPVIRVLQRS